MTSRRGVAVAALVIGVGLVAAPFAFSMFERAPKGGDMLDEFRPYMNEETISKFQGWLADIGRAEAEARGFDDVQGLRGLERFHDQWVAIDDEMGDMLRDMEASLDNFAAVDALPPFPLFPFFFVLPGLMAAGLAVSVLRSPSRRPLGALAVLGVALVAAPFAFSMFERAPLGKEMIDTFRPLMTEEKTRRIQGYFLVLASAEADLRLRADVTDAEASQAFVDQWPTISNEMAPMIGAMIDNLDNYAAIDALPPFSLFPWFFVAPGVMLAGLGFAGHRRSAQREGPVPVVPEPQPSTRSA